MDCHADLCPLCYLSSSSCGGGGGVPPRVVYTGHPQTPAEGREEHPGTEGGEEAGGAGRAGLHQCHQPEGSAGICPQGCTRKEPACEELAERRPVDGKGVDRLWSP
ncbi:hypothetical protein GJAV_G00097500 [Gymnothorax javanicus]|nr:hypothetical protein GJAV_G00097500 [Gymnothorax javanicus]